MENLNFNLEHYNQMVIIDEDYKETSFEELKEKVEKGSKLVSDNKGFANIDTKLNEQEMICVGAFIDFRLAKKDLGEFVEEIDD